MGVHRGARDRRLPRRRRGGRRSRRPAAHGAVRDPRPAALADRRSRAPGTGPHPGVHRARCRDGRRRRGRRARRSLGGDLRARRAVDDRRHPLPPGALRAAAVAVPHRLRARQRQHGARAARLRGHPRGSAGRGRAAPVHRGRRRVLGRCGRVVRRGRPPRGAAVRRPSATARAEPSQPGTGGGRGYPRGRAEPRPDPHPRSRGRAGPDPGRPHRASRWWSRSSCWAPASPASAP